MSEIYIVIVEDRHTDVKVVPFENKDHAIGVARSLAKQYCKFETDYEESDIKGCLFNAVYSCEGDCVSVVARKLEEKIEGVTPLENISSADTKWKFVGDKVK